MAYSWLGKVLSQVCHGSTYVGLLLALRARVHKMHMYMYGIHVYFCKFAIDKLIDAKNTKYK